MIDMRECTCGATTGQRHSDDCAPVKAWWESRCGARPQRGQRLDADHRSPREFQIATGEERCTKGNLCDGRHEHMRNFTVWTWTDTAVEFVRCAVCREDVMPYGDLGPVGFVVYDPEEGRARSGAACEGCSTLNPAELRWDGDRLVPMVRPASDASEAEWYAWFCETVPHPWRECGARPHVVTVGYLDSLLALSRVSADVTQVPETATVRVTLRDVGMAVCAGLQRFLREYGLGHVQYIVEPAPGTAEASEASAAATLMPFTFADVRSASRALASGPCTQHGDLVHSGDHWQYVRASDAMITTACFPEMLKIARETGLPVRASMMGVRVIVRPDSDLVGLTQVWMNAKDGDTVDGRSANATQLRPFRRWEDAPTWPEAAETDEELRLRLLFLGAAEPLAVASGKDLDDIARKYGVERKPATFVGVDPAVGLSKTDILAGFTGVGMPWPERPQAEAAAADGHSVRLPRPGAFAVAIGEALAGVTRWAATAEGQRAIRDLHVRRACEDVPPGCDALRWRNVVHVVAADCEEQRKQQEWAGAGKHHRVFVGTLRSVVASAREAVQQYARHRFVFRYSERDALLATSPRDELAERYLRAYEAGR